MEDTEQQDNSESAGIHGMSTNPNSNNTPRNAAASTPATPATRNAASSTPATPAKTPKQPATATPPAGPLAEETTQPFIFIHAPFDLSQYSRNQVKEHGELNVELQPRSAGLTFAPTRESIDRVPVRILTEYGKHTPLLPHNWILERATDNADLRGRVRGWSMAVKTWKKNRNQGPKRKDGPDLTLAVKYLKGWLNGVSSGGNYEPMHLEFYLTKLDLPPAKKAKFVRCPSLHSVFSTESSLCRRNRLDRPLEVRSLR